MNHTIAQLQKLSEVPPDGPAFDAWLEQRDAMEFLKRNAKEDTFVVYAATSHLFLHAAVVPNRALEPFDGDDLLSWNSNASSSWGIAVRYTSPPEVSIEPPLSITGSKAIDQGEQLVFARFFEGRAPQSYYEFLQRFTHLFGLHYIEEREAYCRLNRHGDLEDAISIHKLPRQNGRYGGSVVCVLRQLMEEYAALNDASVVRMFDFTRFKPSSFGGWGDERTDQRIEESGIVCRFGIHPGRASYSRGVQIIRPSVTKAEVAQRHSGETSSEEHKYATFIAHDWKNGVIAEISCSPDSLSNYFTESKLPFDTTPAFFRPEVLLKYKADPDKYVVQERSITCRGAWYLKSYDINEAGQVHAYLYDLQKLPYEEQVYWKSFNEPPRAPLAERAYTTDFQGDFYETYNPLASLKEKLRQLSEARVPWWTLRSDKLPDQVNYPATASPEEWASELMGLDKLVTEGFEERWLRKRAIALGQEVKASERSLALIAACLRGSGFDAEHASALIEPFRQVGFLRNKLKGHAGSNDVTAIRARALRQHGSYRAHFEALCSECDESLAAISEGLGNPDGSSATG